MLAAAALFTTAATFLGLAAAQKCSEKLDGYGGNPQPYSTFPYKITVSKPITDQRRFKSMTLSESNLLTLAARASFTKPLTENYAIKKAQIL